jgi:hypothetical protein
MGLVFFPACKNENGEEKKAYDVRFLPRKASFLFASFGDAGLSGSVNKDRFHVSVETSNFDINDAYAFSLRHERLDNSIPSLEQQMELDCRAKFPSEKNLPNSHSLFEKGVRQTFFDIEYRTTAVRNLTITADVPLFGKPAGESLNDFFDITGYEPPMIASSVTNALLYAYSSSTYPETLSEWLNLSPLAQAAMYLTPNREMEELPVTLRFEVKMETTEGTILSATTQAITITE